jgi:protein-L-isoaspartate O-methyltransferase
MTRLRRRPRRQRVGMSTTDCAFDELVPSALRHLSQTHWTPVDVAIRATSLLSPTPHTRVLDVGSGVGKFCAVGALSASGTWCGVEQHDDLVIAARRLSRALGVANRTTFLHGDVLAIDWSEFDAVYLYNPFELPLFPEALTTQDHAHSYKVQVACVQQRLAALRGGTRVLTLHGFGGVMPATYELLYHERVPVVGLDLVLYIQRSRLQRVWGPS